MGFRFLPNTHAPVGEAETKSTSSLYPSWRDHLLRKSGAIIKQAFEPLAKKQMPAVLFRLCEEGQQNSPVSFCHVVGTEKLQRVREVDHLRDGRRLFK